MRKKPSEPDFKDTLEHILVICDIYECSSNRVERIEAYTKSVLDELKGRTKNANSKSSSKVGRKGK